MVIANRNVLITTMSLISQIILPLILFIFIEMKLIHCHSCVIFAMKFVNMYND